MGCLYIMIGTRYGRVSSSLEKASTPIKVCLFPTPGGEPLWRVIHDLALFLLPPDLDKECGNRRLPRITQREVFN